jgi:hypothetical protein
LQIASSMGKFNLKTFLRITTLAISLSFTSYLGWSQTFFKKKKETEISFPNHLPYEQVDFNLKSLGQRKFSIQLNQSTKVATKVKIFDILGNLIKEDYFLPNEENNKLYDFSHLNSHMYVVEVGNSKYNITKSIYALPPGSKHNELNRNK